MIEFKERPRKVHLFHDQQGATYKATGGRRPYANTLCKGNFAGPELLTTDDPRKVTCRVCQKKLQEDPPARPFIFHGLTPEAMAEIQEKIRRSVDAATRQFTRAMQVRPDPSLELLLGEEVAHSEHLAEVLRYAFDLIEEDRQHVIAVPGTQITAGQIITGALAEHERRKRGDDDG